MHRIDRIDTRGNIREHWTIDDRTTLCGLVIELRQKPCENSPCLRCQKIVLAASRKHTMQKHADSHVDHGLTEAQLCYLFDRFVDRTSFFLETVELPEDLGTVPCGLWGPIMGDPPIDETEVTRATRGTRAWTSRLVDRGARPTRQITVIAGPHDGQPCVLYTAFGGTATPQEPGDIRGQLEALEDKRRALPDRSPESAEHTAIYAQIVALRAKRDAADAFWRDHALAK